MANVSRVRAGDDILEHFTASAFNAFAENANKVHQFDQRGIPLDLENNANLISFRNDSGANRARYDILALTGVTFTPTDNLSHFQADPIFTATLPVAADTGKFGMLVDAVGTLTGNKYGRAAISGTWVVKLLINHVQHTHADIVAGTARLTSNWYGGARILYKETGTGEKWAVIRFCEQFRGPIEVKVSDAAGIAAGNIGGCTVWYQGAASNPVNNIQAEFKWMAGSSGTLTLNSQALAWWVPDQQRYKIYQSVCPVQ